MKNMLALFVLLVTFLITPGKCRADDPKFDLGRGAILSITVNDSRVITHCDEMRSRPMADNKNDYFSQVILQRSDIRFVLGTFVSTDVLIPKEQSISRARELLATSRFARSSSRCFVSWVEYDRIFSLRGLEFPAPEQVLEAGCQLVHRGGLEREIKDEKRDVLYASFAPLNSLGVKFNDPTTALTWSRAMSEIQPQIKQLDLVKRDEAEYWRLDLEVDGVLKVGKPSNLRSQFLAKVGTAVWTEAK